MVPSDFSTCDGTVYELEPNLRSMGSEASSRISIYTQRFSLVTRV